MKVADALARNPGLGLVVGGVLVAGLAWWLFRDKLAAVGQAINPASDQNIVNKAVTAAGAALTGDDSFSLGSWLYDKFGGGSQESNRIALERLPADERTWYEFWRKG